MITKVYTLSLTYSLDRLFYYFSNIAHHPWSMLLTSGHSNHQYSRFDIFSTDPCSTITTYRDITVITQGNSVTHSKNDPLVIVQQQCDILGIKVKSNSNLPFQGGAIGLFGYDLGRRFEKIPQIAKDDITTPDMAIGIYDWALIADHYLKKLTLVSLNSPQDRWQWLLSQNNILKSEDFILTSDWESNLTFDDYAKRFYIIQEYIHAGDCYQVNLAQRFQATYRGNEWQAFLYLNKYNRAPFSAFLKLPTSSMLSFSPERFLLLQNRQIESRPIKGTIPRLFEPIADLHQARKLAHSIKDRAENLMIVDLLRNDIGRVAIPGSILVPELFVVEPFPTLYHLVSTVRGFLKKKFSPVDLLRSCFPGGSITGAPKIRAMEIIEELEPHCRNAWCGSIGYISLCGRMDININIRTLIAEKQYIYCTAGGGLVADSILKEEYEEIFHKINPIMSKLKNK
ncbi:aminodeoxychorismate synthase component 1 [Pantoea sp. Aalb]|uniref:aminodeoxychorismate synthase component 1 n=1 Tax=Pantoea sp. Aalb TaxID=2576762 RepID=UPI00132A718E|nr:aminodeoxychorismate synthase component 1 [Pantoea sp. Aalb]MXP67375.1 aminodeoxychorismate synthase component 1 [Pantoea sp. Aalb]